MAQELRSNFVCKYVAIKGCAVWAVFQAITEICDLFFYFLKCNFIKLGYFIVLELICLVSLSFKMPTNLWKEN